MNQFKLLELFCKSAKKFMPEIDEVDLEYNLLKYQIDELGVNCSDGALLQAFEGLTDRGQNEIYQLLEQIYLDYVKNFQ